MTRRDTQRKGIALFGRHGREAARRRSRRRRGIVAGIASVVVELGILWLRARRLGGNIVVRCRSGHLYTTIWVPGLSAKSVRLGPWRLQRCPVGRHWSIVTPVRESDLPEEERRRAHAIHDVRIP